MARKGSPISHGAMPADADLEALQEDFESPAAGVDLEDPPESDVEFWDPEAGDLEEEMRGLSPKVRRYLNQQLKMLADKIPGLRSASRALTEPKVAKIEPGRKLESWCEKHKEEAADTVTLHFRPHGRLTEYHGAVAVFEGKGKLHGIPRKLAEALRRDHPSNFAITEAPESVEA